MRIKTAQHLKQLESGLSYRDLQEYVRKQSQVRENYGVALLDFYLVTAASRKLRAFMAKRNKVSLFDYLKGLPSFLK